MSFWFLLRKVLTPWPALGIFAIGAVVLVGGGYLEDLFFVTESIGLVLIFVGVLVAFKFRSRPAGLLVAALLLGSAGQIKEVFIFAPVSLIFLASRYPSGWRKGVTWLGIGWLSAGVVAALYLITSGTGVFAAYLEVLGFKSAEFPRPGVADLVSDAGEMFMTLQGQWIPGIFIFVLATPIIFGLVRFKRQKSELEEIPTTWKSPLEQTITVLWLTIVVGLLWQGRGMYGHYALPFLFTTLLMISILLAADIRNLKILASENLARLLSVLIVISLFPSITYVMWVGGRANSFDLERLVTSASNLESEENLRIFNEISNQTMRGDCIEVAYGWAASSYYLYSGRQPCSRFIVPALWTNSELQAELRSDLMLTPPALLVIDPSARREISVRGKDITAIDKEVFPFENVARQCYMQSDIDPILWTAALGSRAAMSTCIQQQLELSGLSWN
jgi:hypothetical protein